MRILPLDAHKQGSIFQNQATFFLFQKNAGETSPTSCAPVVSIITVACKANRT